MIKMFQCESRQIWDINCKYNVVHDPPTARRPSSRHQTGSDWTLYWETSERRGDCWWAINTLELSHFNECSHILYDVSSILTDRKNVFTLEDLRRSHCSRLVQAKTSLLWLKSTPSPCWRNPPLGGSKASGWIWPASLGNTFSWRKRLIATPRYAEGGETSELDVTTHLLMQRRQHIQKPE